MQNEYEFDEAENTEIGGLADSMVFVGTFSIIFGMLALCMTVVTTATMSNHFGGASLAPNLIGGLIQGIVIVAMGYWSRVGGQEFRKVVQTQGEDISHMMSALRELAKYFKLEKFLIMLALVLIGLALILGLAFGG